MNGALKMYEQMSADANGNFPLPNTPEAKAAFLRRYALANTDWFGLLFKNNFVQEHSLAISFGTDRSQSYFSTSYYGNNQPGRNPISRRTLTCIHYT